MSGFFIGIDVGGTNLKAGLTDETGRLLAAARRPLDFRGAETFAAEERKLVEKFAARDEDGNIRVAQGRFTFRAPGERGEYEEQHRQLAETPAEIRFTKLRAPAPDTISVKSLEVLSRFIDFRGGDRK